MKESFFNRPVDYFWEFEYPFAEYFLKEIFGEKIFRRRCSLIGEGIFNLIYLNNKVYDVSFKEGKAMVINDGKTALRDADKDVIVNKITKVLKENNIPFAVNSGKYITFKLQNKYIIKLEIIKKIKEPQGLGRYADEW